MRAGTLFLAFFCEIIFQTNFRHFSDRRFKYADLQWSDGSFKAMSNSSQLKLLGEILREAELITAAQIEVALHEQRYYSLPIGEILTLHGWLQQETADFFADRWSDILKSSSRHPLGHYLELASLLDVEQISTILEEQRRLGIRFGAVAVLKGWLKKRTVDYFLENLVPQAKTTSDFQDKRTVQPSDKVTRSQQETTIEPDNLIMSESLIIYPNGSSFNAPKKPDFSRKTAASFMTNSVKNVSSKTTSRQTNPNSDDFDLASSLDLEMEGRECVLNQHDDEIFWIN